MKKFKQIILSCVVVVLLYIIGGNLVSKIEASSNPEVTSPTIADEQLVFSPSYFKFNILEFLKRQGGILAQYSEVIEGKTWTAAEIIEFNAHFFSINPQVLIALLEHYNKVVSTSGVNRDVLDFAMRKEDTSFRGLYKQVNWAAEQLFTGFYARKQHNGDKTLILKDGTTWEVDSNLNAGTFAIQYLLSQSTENEQSWKKQISQDDGSFFKVFNRFFGSTIQSSSDGEMSTFDLSAASSIPGARLPWTLGETWYYTGGPHNNAGGSEGCVSGPNCPQPWSAVDFAPLEIRSCPGGGNLPNRWIVAARSGNVIFSGQALVRIDHGDGWVTNYSHVSSTDRVGTGSISQGSRVGHPSCEVEPGGRTEGIHLHFTSLFNGVFQNINGTSLSGWTINETTHYNGTMRCIDGRTRTASTSRSGNDISDNCHGAQPSPPLPPVPGAVDTVLIIDSSGSMGSNDKDNHRLSAARAYLTVSQNGDFAGVVDFDDQVRLASPLVKLPENTQKLIDAINSINSNGGTNVGLGVGKGCEALSQSTSGNQKKAAILLTDGQGDYNNQHECFKNAGRNWPIYTFSFGEADDALLQSIASHTGGAFARLPTIGFVCEFQRVRAKIAGVAPGPCNVTAVTQGGVVSLIKTVLSKLVQATFSISWPGSDVVMTLTSPSGRVIDRNTATPDVVHDRGSTFEVYTILEPEAGDWKVNLFGADVPPQGEEVVFGMTMIPKVTLSEVVINDGDDYTNNRKVKISLNYPDNTSKIRLSNFPFRKESIIPRWQNPESELNWYLSDLLGENTVYAQFKFDDGTTSEISSDSIIYDRTKPWGIVIINNGASSANTNGVTVKVKITARDLESSVDQMQVGNSASFSGANWQPYQEEFNWQLEPLEGNRPQVKRIYVRLKDKAGNISSILRGSILLIP